MSDIDQTRASVYATVGALVEMQRLPAPRFVAIDALSGGTLSADLAFDDNDLHAVKEWAAYLKLGEPVYKHEVKVRRFYDARVRDEVPFWLGCGWVTVYCNVGEVKS